MALFLYIPYASVAEERFIITVKTDNSGASNNDQFTIPIQGAYSYLYDVETSDGQTITGLSSNYTITFPSSGTYDIYISGLFPTILFPNLGTGDNNKLIDIKQWGNNEWDYFEGSFRYCEELTIITATDSPILTNIIDNSLAGMFRNCSLLEYLNISNWDISAITDISLFIFSSPLFNYSFANWDINQVTDFTNFASNNTGLSRANYDAILVSWAAQAPQTGISISFGNAQYTEGSAAETARNTLTTTYSWTISDGGLIAASLPLSNIIHEWKLNGNSNDTVGSSNGTDTSVSYVSGLVDDCAVVTAATTSVINVGDASTLSFGDGVSDVPFSASFAVNFSSLSPSLQRIIVKKSPTNTNWEYTISRSGNSIEVYLLNNGSVSNRLVISQSVSLTVSTWYHITLTYDGSSSANGLSLYIDGVYDGFGRSTVGTYTAMNTFTDDLLFGRNSNNTSQSVNGSLDVIRLWDKKLTVGEVILLATEELAGTDINP
jgi:surface protein